MDKLLQPDDVDCVIYHDPCSDGTGSGYVAWKYLSTKFPDRNVMYCPARIGAPLPLGIEGKNVLICDYSYKKDVIEILKTKVDKFLIIDHHISAEKDLKELEDQYKLFDMNHSGAMLTWHYFFPDKEPPLMIKHIEDNDIWTKKLEGNDDFVAWFYTLPLDFNEYDKYIDDDVLLNMIGKGKAYRELNEYYINQAIDHAIPKFSKIKDKYYFIAYVNSTVCKSDIGNKIFNKLPLIDFSAIYSTSDYSNDTTFSLRSTPCHADVSEIATRIGGGGHKAASGVKVDYITNHLPGQSYDSGQLYKLLDKVYFGNKMISDQKLNIIYLNSSSHKYELSHYLLQTKYIDKSGYSVQQAENLYRKQNNSLDSIKFDVAVILDIGRENTELNIFFGDTVNNEQKMAVLNEYISEYKIENKFFTVQVTGIKHEL